jgi:ribosomal-protein-alanine N-acetyltransferase
MTTVAQPIIRTERLTLRPSRLEDAEKVQRLAGSKAIADTTARVPHPYEDGMAEEWIGMHKRLFRRRKAVIYAITRTDTGSLVGAIGLELRMANERAEIGYWIGRRYWNRGYATEAAEAILMYGFTELGLQRIYAHHFERNPSSGRVMQKIGMKREGLLRRHFKKGERFENLVFYGILREEF